MKSRVYLRHPEFSDSHSFVEAAKRSRMLHKPWISAPADVSAYRLYLKRIALHRWLERTPCQVAEKFR